MNIEQRAKSKEQSKQGGRTQPYQRGFTIVELMISTAVFSMVLLLCSVAIVQVGKTFFKGVTVNRTQDTARKVTDDIVQAIQFGAAGLPRTNSASYTYGSGSITVNALCIGDTRYNYVTDRSLGSNTTGQSPHVLWKDRVSASSACSVIALVNWISKIPSAGGEEMLGDNMRLPVMGPPTQSGNTWKVAVTVAYGDASDLFTKNSDGSPNYSQCISTNAGGQFCAVSAISTNVVKRL